MKKVALVKVGLHRSGSHWASEGMAGGPDYLEKYGDLDGLLQWRFGKGNVEKFTIDCTPKGISRNEDIECLAEIIKISKEVQELTQRLFNKGYFVVLLGGEQTADLGFVAGAATSNKCMRDLLAGHQEGVSVTSQDGHLDLMTYLTSKTGKVHGQTLASHCGHGHPNLVGFHGDFRPRILSRNTYVVGPNTQNTTFFTGESTPNNLTLDYVNRLRAYKTELEHAEKWGVKYIEAHDIDDSIRHHGYNIPIWQKTIREELIPRIRRTAGHIVLCDLDHVHQDDVPAVAMPNTGGLRKQQSLAVADEIARQTLSKLMGVAILEADPDRDHKDHRTATFVVDYLEHLTQYIWSL